jgi:hypothetical protein
LLETLLQLEAEPERVLRYAEDRVGLALSLIAAGDLERARRLHTEVLPAAGLDPALKRRAQKELWLLLRRAGRAHEGLTLLETMCDETVGSRTVDLFPYLELAKYFEHIARDYRAAERIVERAIRTIDLAGRRTERADLIYRLNRIQRKQRSVF